jgi:hypothetical protein
MHEYGQRNMMAERKTTTGLSYEHLVQAIFQTINDQEEVVRLTCCDTGQKTAGDCNAKRHSPTPSFPPTGLLARWHSGISTGRPFRVRRAAAFSGGFLLA